jgi:uncharacterized protein with PQ loop repeat
MNLPNVLTSMLIYTSVIMFVIGQLPQVILSIKTRSTKGISLWTQFMYFLTVLFGSIVLTNFGITSIWIPVACNLCLTLAIIVMKLHFDYKCSNLNSNIEDDNDEKLLNL